jgi:hypothetical protein
LHLLPSVREKLALSASFGAEYQACPRAAHRREWESGGAELLQTAGERLHLRECGRGTSRGEREIPEVLQTRLLSLRGFDNAATMQAADVVHGREILPVIEQMLGDSRIEYIHVHNAKPGCFAARIDRV